MAGGNALDLGPAVRNFLDLSDAGAVTRCAETTKIAFRDPKDGGDTRVVINGHDATDEIRTETCGAAASAIAAIPAVRAALLDKQKAFRKAPGLVADGRDMASVVFPDAVLKIFLTASPEERARRRYKQLMDKGMGANMAALLQDIRERDQRDTMRATAPLQQSVDAVLIDTTGISAAEAIAQVLALYRQAPRAS